MRETNYVNPENMDLAYCKREKYNFDIEFNYQKT